MHSYTGRIPKPLQELTAAAEQVDRAAINATTDNRWEQVHIAVGIADCDPKIDPTVIDTVQRADRTMYAGKRRRKQGRK